MTAEAAENDNADWGRTAETAACERWGLEFVGSDPDEPGPWWFDARARDTVRASRPDCYGSVVAGTPVEVKAARYRIDNGSPRRGRWWLAERSHERLLGADGEYALAVYGPGAGVLAMCLRPAWVVDSLVTRWSRSGRDHYTERSAQIPWSRVFDPDEDIASCSVSSEEGLA